MQHLLKFLDKVYKYEMDPTRTVGTTERTRDVGWTSLENLISAAMTDGQTDGRTE